MSDISSIREFNRVVTLRVGALEARFLGRARPLGASRLLFEIGALGAEVRDLRQRLDLDSGYLSRLLRGLESEGLVQVKASETDSRVRVARLTDEGSDELSELNRLSNSAAANLLERLREPERKSLVSAMSNITRILKLSSTSIDVEDPRSPAARYCVQQYYRELSERFEVEFDPEKSLPATVDELTPPRGYFLLAKLNGQPIGCGALKCHADYGEVKRMWVAATSRGLGVGRRLLERLEELARDRGLGMLRLETNKSLIEAQSLYKKLGFQEVTPFNNEPYAHHWFEKRY